MNKVICHHITVLQIRALKKTTPHRGGREGLQHGPSFVTRSHTATLFDSLTD